MQALDFLVQAEHCLQRFVWGRLRHSNRLNAQRCEYRPALRALDRDLKCGTLARGLIHQKFVNGAPQRGGERAQHRQARLALAILDCRDLRRCPVDRRGELFELQPELRAPLANAAPEGERVGGIALGVGRHCDGR